MPHNTFWLHSFSSPLVSQLQCPFHTHPIFYPLFLVFSPLSLVCVAHMLFDMAFHRSMLDLLEATPLKKIDSRSFSSCELQSAPWLVGDHLSSPCWGFVWLKKVLSMLSHVTNAAHSTSFYIWCRVSQGTWRSLIGYAGGPMNPRICQSLPHELNVLLFTWVLSIQMQTFMLA